MKLLVILYNSCHYIEVLAMKKLDQLALALLRAGGKTFSNNRRLHFLTLFTFIVFPSAPFLPPGQHRIFHLLRRTYFLIFAVHHPPVKSLEPVLLPFHLYCSASTSVLALFILVTLVSPIQRWTAKKTCFKLLRVKQILRFVVRKLRCTTELVLQMPRCKPRKVFPAITHRFEIDSCLQRRLKKNSFP